MRSRVPGGLAAAATALSLTLTVAACSNDPGTTATPPGPATTTTAPVAAEHNPADVTFAQSMIPHHAQAVAMARQAPARAASAQVHDLAGRIGAGQGPEIQQMTGMLSAWGLPTVSPDTGMPGMMSDAEMGQLAGLNGPAFDRAFLSMMIQHHTGAITMARTELGQGLNPQAKALAGSIIVDQQCEVSEMQTLLTRV